MPYICVSGNTGAGKSTMLRYLSNSLSRHHPAVSLLDEGTLHHRLLQRMFDDPATWGLIMQLNFLVERTAAMVERLSGGQSLLVMERSPSEDPIFFERLLAHGYVDEGLRGPYQQIHGALTAKLPAPDGYVFLNADPEVCLDRLRTAVSDGSRPVELAGQQLIDYVLELHAGYQKWRTALPNDVRIYDLAITDASGPAERQLTECLTAVSEWVLE